MFAESAKLTPSRSMYVAISSWAESGTVRALNSPKNQMTVSFAESYFNDTCPLLGESML